MTIIIFEPDFDKKCFVACDYSCYVVGNNAHLFLFNISIIFIGIEKAQTCT